MKNLVQKLKDFNEMLLGNAGCDWDGNDPADEFAELSKQLITIIIEAEGKILSPRDITIERLGHYVSEDDTEEAYDKLLAQMEIDGTVYADDFVCMWEPLEWRYTVSQLLDEV